MTTSPTTALKNFDELQPVDVSVVIPVYNCERYLRETISSAREHDMPRGSVEIIAVDDGSTDSSLQILTDLAESENDLQVYSISNSGSAAAPRNYGLKRAQGRYVFFLDADDKLSPDALSRMTTVADDTGSGVVLGKMGLFGQKRAGDIPSTAFGRTLFATDFIESKAHSTLGSWKLFRRSILVEHDIWFPLGYKIGEDQPFTMKAYLNSPHVSILADKIYYWIRGRDDGTNITTTGQPPSQHLKRITTLIQAIVENTEPGERRDQLLRRPIIGSAGVTSVFGKKMLPAHDRAEREAMLREFQEVVAPLWTASVRDRGLPESQILVDLGVRNDIDGVEAVSRLLAEKKPIPLTLDDDRTQLIYHPHKGSSIGKLRVRLQQNLESITSVGKTAVIRGEVGIFGLDEVPDSAQLIFQHRKLETKVVSKLDISRTYARGLGAQVRFTAKFSPSKLTDSGIWDAFIKVKWGQLVARERFGESRSAGLDTSPLLIGDPTEAVVFFAKSNGLAIDIGPTEKHLNPVKRDEIQVMDQFEVGRFIVLVVNGPVANMASASFRRESSRTDKPAELVVHSTTHASVVVPRSAVRRRSFVVELTDKEGNTADVTSANDLA
ncbi:glycosyltransferase family 2 protein [Brevibacterium oceani]|uniref:glycosyltransferase family 2 protein n=1 Tax=Brevibacterium oceani TaxID=358099 RepID=UPI0015E7D641|nr:glycosyltransferase family 2 protein [Brevibacterium oceani]